MQFITVIAFLFVASAIAVPVPQIINSGINTYGDDGEPSKTDGSGNIVRVADGALTANGRA